jgi:DNA gyrase subunit A
MGRATQGVKIIRLRDEDSIASVAKVSKWEAEEQILLDEDGNVIETAVSKNDETEETTTNETSDKENIEDNTNETEENNEEQNTENNEE